MPLLAMGRVVRYRISHIPGWVVSWVCGRRVRATIGDARLSRCLKQAIFNTETERGITEGAEKDRMALRARRCRLALAGDPCRKMVVPARPNGGCACASLWHSVFLVLSLW